MAISVESAGLYSLQTHNREDCIRHEALRNSRDRSWGSLICLIALCEVLGVSITSHYPNTSLKYTESVMNVQVYPRTKLASNSIHLLWSRSGNMDNTPNDPYQPNHFVPIFIVDKSKMPKLSQTKIKFKKVDNEKNSSNELKSGQGSPS